MTGGPGRQLVSYDEKTAPVEVDLTRATGQGTSGEGDEIRGVEDVLGGKAPGPAPCGSPALTQYRHGDSNPGFRRERAAS